MKEQITTCQVCGRAIKSTKGVIAHHGYQRPYKAGWQSGSCAGARYLPYEQSCERLREVIGHVEVFLAEQEAAYKSLLENPPETLIRYEKRGSWGKEEKHEYARPEDFNPEHLPALRMFTYELAYVDLRDNYARTIRMTKSDLETMKRRLAEWKPPVSIAQEESIPARYNENAGYIAQAQYNGADIVIYLAKEQGVDTGTKYAVVCEKHSCMVGTSSVNKAQKSMKYPDFCEECMK